MVDPAMKLRVLPRSFSPHGIFLELSRAIPRRLVLYDRRSRDREELFERIGDADIVVAVSYPVDGETIRRAKKLKMVAVSFTGYDHIDLEAAREKGVLVSNFPTTPRKLWLSSSSASYSLLLRRSENATR